MCRVSLQICCQLLKPFSFGYLPVNTCAVVKPPLPPSMMAAAFGGLQEGRDHQNGADVDEFDPDYDFDAFEPNGQPWQEGEGKPLTWSALSADIKLWMGFWSIPKVGQSGSKRVSE